MDPMGKGSPGTQEPLAEMLSGAMGGDHRLIHLHLHQAGAGLNLGLPGKHHFKIQFLHVAPKSCMQQLVLGRNILDDVQYQTVEVITVEKVS